MNRPLSVSGNTSARCIALALACWVGFSSPITAADQAQIGQGLYPVCTACHGAAGQGNRAMGGPKIAGQRGYYLLSQLQHFQTGTRGAAPGDAKGRQMAAMSKGPRLASVQALESLVAYIETFPNTPTDKTTNGDAARGKSLYATCASCHGEAGEGLEMTGAPRLQGQNDWYLIGQLRNFAESKRGYAPGDHRGRQMRAMMGVLQDQSDYEDVVAYISILGLEGADIPQL